MSTTRTVHLVATRASLLSGGLQDCRTPEDETCSAGVAAVSALARYRNTDGRPLLVIPSLDKRSPFVQMHPLGWSVNRLVLSDMLGWTVFTSSPSILTQHKEDFEVSQRDLSFLQTHKLPFLLTNVYVPPDNSWHQYTEAVHFDSATGLAVLSIDGKTQPFNWPQIDSAVGILNYIAKLNEECGSSDVFENATTTCWVPVIFYAYTSLDEFNAFIEGVTNHTNPPALVIDVEADNESYNVPRQVNGGTWVVSYTMDTEMYYQHDITIDNKGLITNVELTTESLEELPDDAKDDIYDTHIEYLRTLADEAEANDPIVGTSGFMPLARDSGKYRRCKGGECEIGNLFTDALRWSANSSVAFVSSGGLRGPGWPAGEVRVSDLWAALPFPNTMCTGTMSGVSLFKLLNYSTSIATFESEDTSDGGRLLQVSGLKVTYNTQLEGSRLISVDVWDKDQEQFVALDRLQLYKFATDSYLCGVYDPYPDLLGGDFVIEGEEPGVIGELLHQDIVGEYLSQLQAPYNTTIQGRLVNNTNATEALNLVQTEGSCEAGNYWIEEKLTCLPCPQTTNVAFSDEEYELLAVSGGETKPEGRVVFVNREVYPISFVPKAIPSWMEFTGSSVNVTYTVNSPPTPLESGESVALEFNVDASGLDAGTALGTVIFGIRDGGNFTGCVGQDATFDVLVRVAPSIELNQLTTPIRAVGLSLMGVIVLTSLLFALLVYRKRNVFIVKTMQPFFLIAMCFGVLVMGATIAPLSIDDGVASTRGCDIACMATPWILSMGCVVSFSALFSKLWRINRLFHVGPFRKVTVKERDVLAPFAVLFTLNFAFLLVWTLVDPLRWTRTPVDGQPWNTYGSCKGEGTVSTVMLSLTAAVNAGALFLACFQAFKARDIGDEFSEGKYLGIALYSWFQLLLVGFPVLFLIDEENVIARYFLYVGLIFALCMSMILLVFTPILSRICRKDTRRGEGVVVVSGLRSNRSTTERRFAESVPSAVVPRESARRGSCVSEMSDNCAIISLELAEEEMKEEDGEDGDSPATYPSTLYADEENRLSAVFEFDQDEDVSSRTDDAIQGDVLRTEKPDTFEDEDLLRVSTKTDDAIQGDVLSMEQPDAFEDEDVLRVSSGTDVAIHGDGPRIEQSDVFEILQAASRTDDAIQGGMELSD